MPYLSRTALQWASRCAKANLAMDQLDLATALLPSPTLRVQATYKVRKVPKALPRMPLLKR